MRSIPTAQMLALLGSLAFVAFQALGTPALHAETGQESVSYRPIGETETGWRLPKEVSGTLTIPSQARKPYPAVVILHGSGGIDGRGAFYAKALNDVGIATFEIKMFSRIRPKSPGDNWPHVFGALTYLAGREEFDPQRIGVMGFSWGGFISLQTVNMELTTLYTGGKLFFAGHASLYPTCWSLKPGGKWRYLMDGRWTGAPVLVQAAEADDYDADGGAACREIEQSLSAEKRSKFRLLIYPSATHKWDSQKGRETFTDEKAFGGKGGQVRVSPDKALAEKSRQEVVGFFSQIFGIQ